MLLCAIDYVTYLLAFTARIATQPFRATELIHIAPSRGAVLFELAGQEVPCTAALECSIAVANRTSQTFGRHQQHTQACSKYSDLGISCRTSS